MNVGCVYVDIRNAFPSVDHEMLLEILNQYGNLGLPSDWFKSYLTNRKMYVDLNNNHSDLVPVTRGVPQGSIFGPLLFNIYYNAVVLRFNSQDVTLFADDTAIVSAANDAATLIQRLQQALIDIDEHLTSLKMELNTKKTFFLIIRSHDASLRLSLNNNCISQCDAFKYLGIYIDNDLSWKTHVTKLICKVHKMLYILHRCSGKSNNDKRLLLFRTYIYPHFLYGIQLYMFCSVSLRAKLEALLRRCCRLVIRDMELLPMISNRSLYSLLGILPLRLLFQHCSAVMLFKILVLKQVPALLSLFTIVTQTGRNSRLVPSDIIVLRMPAVKVESSRHNFAYWGAKLWNTIPVIVRSSNSLSIFSKLYHTHLVARLPDISFDHYDILDFV
jgi:hypothetical protein